MRSLAIRSVVSVAVLVSLLSPASADEQSISLAISSEIDGKDVPVSIEMDADKKFVSAVLTGPTGKEIVGQLTGPGLLSTSGSRELHFIVPSIQRGKATSFEARLSTASHESPSYSWDVNAGKTATLSHAGRKILRYMFERVDDSSPERRGETYKVYHHVFDPTGEFLVTKGPGGRYPHHRGLFFGFNRISYGDDQKADAWHCRNGESQVHLRFLATESGPVLGRHQVLVDWNGQDGKAFAKEKREMTVYNVDGGTLIEFASVLNATGGPVRLDGDPQHAGFQFRGSQHIADVSKDKTYYLRPDGRGKPGDFRNWKNPGDPHANLEWNAQSFVIDDHRFTCCYLDRPDNPKEARFSERDYGRFGSYFEYDLTAQKPLRLNYRVWLQTGEMSADDVSTRHRAFVQKPTVTVQ